MGRLFWKILFIVLISNALVFLATIVVSSLLHTEHPIVKIQLEDTFRLGKKTVERYEQGGSAGLARFQGKVNRHGHTKIYLLNADKQSLAHEIPEKLATQIQDYPTIIRPHENKAGFRSLYAITLVSKSGERYYFVASYRPGAIPRNKRPFYQDFRLLLLLTGIVISSALIAWLFNRPMREMKQVTRQFAEGNHDTRVSPAMAKRRDAIGELANEFNHMAEQVDSLLSSHKRLLRDVSHELRSPLARMQVALSLIEQRGESIRSKEHERLQLEIDRLNELIGQILTLTRLESGSQVLDRKPTDLPVMINGLIQDVRYEHSNDSRKINFAGPESMMINVDPVRLESALENVLRNAMKYTKDDTSVTVALSKESNTCRLTVSDQGPGVPDEALEQIFNAFYRTQDARDEKTGGVGVGLAISRRIIEMHRGKISAKNLEEGGLELTIELPFTVS